MAEDARPHDEWGGAPAPLQRLTPRLRSRRMISLTPLVDIVFLLLTFFMLSSNLSPFGLLPFAGEDAGAAAAASPGASSGIDADLVLSVAAGSLRLGGLELAPAALGEALGHRRADGMARLTILASGSASVQDLIDALDAARAAGFASVALVDLP